MRMEELPEDKKMYFAIRKTQFWIGFLTGLMIFICSFIVYPIVYVQDRNYTLDENTKAIENHEERIKNLENLGPKVEELIKKIDELGKDIKSSNDELFKLFRDFDLRKKK